MSMPSRREYLNVMRRRYRAATSRKARSAIIDEVTATLGYHRKYAIQVLNQRPQPPRPPIRRRRKPKYLECLHVIQLVWQALDYPCAERLHPVLPETARLLEAHGVLTLTPQVEAQLAAISRSTLARYIAKWPSPKITRLVRRPRPSQGILSEVPIARYLWNENRPGALELDLVEHNGGSTRGHYAYTLNVTDVVTHYSRRRAVMGRGQAGIHAQLQLILNEWPYPVWAIHTDNGSEFLNSHLVAFCRERNLEFTRSRPYRKNDNAHVEQKNRQFVREIVGYERYDTPEEVEWLNRVYATLDPYVNLFLPTRKVIRKERVQGRVRKYYDRAQTPFQRALDMGVLYPEAKAQLTEMRRRLNPLALHQELELLLLRGPDYLVNDQAAD